MSILRSCLLLCLAIPTTYASDVYLPSSSDLKDHQNNSLTQVQVPAGLEVSSTQIASGPQSMVVNVSSTSDTGLKIDIGSVTHTIAPGSSKTVQVDLGYGTSPLTFNVRPQSAIAGNSVEYSLRFPSLSSIYNPSGWQEIYNDPNGCVGGCSTQSFYGSVTTQKVWIEADSSVRCSKGGLPDAQGRCTFSIEYKAKGKCKTGWTLLGNQCEKVISGHPVQYKCPDWKAIDNGHWPQSKEALYGDAGEACYRIKEAQTCPSGYYLQPEGDCFPMSVAKRPDGSCPPDYPHTSNSNRNRCYTKPVGFKEPFCGAGEEIAQYNKPYWCRVKGSKVVMTVENASGWKCSDGSYHSSTNASCNETLYEPASFSCPQGGTLKGTKCVTEQDGGVPEEFCKNNESVSPVNGKCKTSSESPTESPTAPIIAPKDAVKIWVK